MIAQNLDNSIKANVKQNTNNGLYTIYDYTSNSEIIKDLTKSELDVYLNKNDIKIMNKSDNTTLTLNESTDYFSLINESSMFDLKDRKVITSFDEFNKINDKISKIIKYDKNTDPIKKHKHNIRRHELFMHEVFGNNYRMFGLEKEFDINDMK